MIENAGTPTLVAGTVRDIMSAVLAPRAVFLDHPVGRTFGRPGDRQGHQELLSKVLAESAHFTAPRQIRDLECEWAAGGRRDWEDEIRKELLADR